MLILNYLHAPVGVPLLRVCGLALSHRAILEGMKSGYRRIALLIHAEDLPSVTDFLARNDQLRDIQLFSSAEDLITTVPWKTEVEDKDITLVAADRVWSGNPFDQLQSSALPDSGTILVNSDGRAIMAKGKEFHLNTKGFAAGNGNFLDDLFPASEQSTLIAKENQWTQISSPTDIEAAEKLLLSSLGKDADGLISRHINRKISLFLTHRLMRTAVTPNQVTAVVFAIGICSGPLMVTVSGYWGLLAGAFLYYLSAILDGCDGELSRLKFQGTPLGAWLDTVVDDIVGLSFLLGLYAVLFHQVSFWGWIGLFAIFFYLLTLVPRYYVLAVYLGTGDYQKLARTKHQSEKISGIAKVIQIFETTFFRTDFIPFFAFATTLLNIPEIFAVLLALGSFASSIDSLLTFSSFPQTSRKRNTSKKHQ